MDKEELFVESKVRYLAGETTQEISRSFGLSSETVRSWLSKQGVKRRRASFYLKKYDYDHNAFNVDSPESFYYAGFLMADGNIYSGRILQLEILEKDIDTLIGFKDFLKYSGNIEKRTRIRKSGLISKYCALRLTAMDLIEQLGRFGIVPRKSVYGKIEKVILESKLKEFFFRGIFDGDGCVHKRKNSGIAFVSFCGTPPVVDAFRDWCWATVREVGSLSVRSKITNVVCFSHRAAYKICNILYGNAYGPRLKRKEDLLKMIFLDRSN